MVTVENNARVSHHAYFLIFQNMLFRLCINLKKGRKKLYV